MAKRSTQPPQRNTDAEDLLSINLNAAASMVRLLSQTSEHHNPADMRRALGMVDLALDQALLGWEHIGELLQQVFPPFDAKPCVGSAQAAE